MEVREHRLSLPRNGLCRYANARAESARRVPDRRRAVNGEVASTPALGLADSRGEGVVEDVTHGASSVPRS